MIIFVILVFVSTISLVLSEPAHDLGGLILRSIWEVGLLVLTLIFLPVQYVPQIHKTYKLKRAESPSITTLCIQRTTWFILPF